MGHVHACVYVFIDHWHCSCDYHTIFMWLSCDFQHWKYCRWFYLMYRKIARLMCSFPDFCLVPLITMYIHVYIIISCDFISWWSLCCVWGINAGAVELYDGLCLWCKELYNCGCLLYSIDPFYCHYSASNKSACELCKFDHFLSLSPYSSKVFFLSS